ncbi:MAG: TonB-dependent receptor [Burkholderiales bacterium]|nr:TonB-dependent receptor [Burkholderiales bacterium]
MSTLARGWPLAGCLVLGVAGVNAQTESPQRVEIKGEADGDTEQRRREPVAKTVYGRAELDKFGDTNVSDVLKRLPGINVSGGSPRMRGLGAGYTLILINGEPAPPGFSLDNLSPSQVERIEVTKGPTAENSAQAVAGTINIILREPPRQRQRELRVGFGFSTVRPVPGMVFTYGDRIGDLSLSLPFSAYGWRGGNENRTDRYTLDTAQQPQHLLSRGEDANWGGGFNFGPRLQWKLSDTDSLLSQTFMQRNNFHSRGFTATDVLAGSTPTSVDDHYRNDGHWQMLRSNLQLVRKWSDGARIDVKAGVQASASHSETPVIGLNGAGAQTIDRHTRNDNHEQGWTSGGKYNRPLADSHTLAFGWDVEQRRRRETRSVVENGQSQLIGFDGEPFHARIERAALFVQDEWDIAPQWSTYLGLRSERISTVSRGSDGELQSRSAVTTPLWHLNYKFDPKGRDLIRMSLTRSYRAPELNALMARPSINATYTVDKPNPEIAPDRVGNPNLKPELATGFDIAFEKYFAQGGVMSIGGFHRSISGLIRNAVSLETVSYSPLRRWVSRPINLASARSTGVEFEIKGRAGELMPSLFAPALGLNLRASFSVYRSAVDGIPAPYNRLEQQQPYAANLGFDHKLQGLPLLYGASLAFTPGYTLQQTLAQQQLSARVRTLDAFALWTFSKEVSFRIGINNVAPLDAVTLTQLTDSAGFTQSTLSRRTANSQVNAGFTIKF